MAVDDLYAIDFFQAVHGNSVMSTAFYYESISATTPGDVPENLATQFAAVVADVWAAVLSEDWSASAISVRRLAPSPINPFSIAAVAAEAIVGAIVSEAVPSNAPMVVTKYSGTVSRRGRGRWYQSGIPENAQDCGQILAASFGAFQTAANSFASWLTEPAGAGEWRPCVVSYAVPGPPLFSEILFCTARPNLANQRGRRSPPATV